MLNAIKGSVLFGAGIALVKIIACADSIPGRLVSNEAAAELKGGCAGVHTPTSCAHQNICSINGYLSGADQKGNKMNFDAGSVPTTYCTKTVGGNKVCADSAATYVSCAGG